MYKELVISIIILLFIFGLNHITQKNTDKTVEQVTQKLQVTREEVLKKEPDNAQATEKINNAYEKWEELDDVLAFYVEHDELEKVKTALTSAKSYIEVEEYTECVEAVDKCIYILDHIHEREMFRLDNIF